MNQSLEQSRKEIERLNHLRDVSDDTRKPFPLGVCNLDFDTVFQERQYEGKSFLRITYEPIL